MHPWIADRTQLIDSSGIRKVFDLAATLEDPINLSIGQPDFDVPEAIQDAAVEAIRGGKNGYSVTQGILPLREELQSRIGAEYGHTDRQLLVTSGTSGALVLAMLAMVNPGDEVIIFDPYFVMYEALVGMVGGTCVLVDTYPDFRIDPSRVAAAITPRTKMILLNSPSNPTGVVAGEDEVQGLAELAAKHNIALLSDEIYRTFCYEQSLVSPAKFNDQTIVVDGFSKSHAVTGWRLGFGIMPEPLAEKVGLLLTHSVGCTATFTQIAGIEALTGPQEQADAVRAEYQKRRDLIIAGLNAIPGITCRTPQGAFYAFPNTRGFLLSSSELSDYLLNEAGVAVLPGTAFGEYGEGYLRLCYSSSTEQIERALERMAGALARL